MYPPSSSINKQPLGHAIGWDNDVNAQLSPAISYYNSINRNIKLGIITIINNHARNLAITTQSNAHPLMSNEY